jgi:hypothetical protein
MARRPLIGGGVAALLDVELSPPRRRRLRVGRGLRCPWRRRGSDVRIAGTTETVRVWHPGRGSLVVGRAAVYLLLIPAALLAVLVGVNVGWRWVFAPLLGYVLLTWLYGSLRALAQPGRDQVDPDAQPQAVSEGERTLFWCEECGTEVLLLVRGTPRAPSHCGQRMHERTEILN